jgi:hypothetical protein
MLYPVEHPLALASVNLTEGRHDPAHVVSPTLVSI